MPRHVPSSLRRARHLAWSVLLIACAPRTFGNSPFDAAVADVATADGIAVDVAPADVVGGDIGADSVASDVVALDTPSDVGVDRATPVVDAVVDVPVDRATPVVDAVVDVPVDRGTPVVDVPVVIDVASPRGYLEACASNADCASGDCLTTPGGARWCTRACGSGRAPCGDGMLCSNAGRCVLDDTGVACTPAASACARRCIASPTGTLGHCTRECSVGADCPATFACQTVPTGGRFCVAAERRCMTAADCTSNLCVASGAGFGVCTTLCTSDADCPRRLIVDNGAGSPDPLVPYRCQMVGTQRVCVPPFANVVTGNGVVRGAQELGESCALSGGNNLCASAVCDAAADVCVQTCTQTSGCPVGFTCAPWQPGGAGSAQYLVCRRGGAGAGAFGATCGRSSDCATGTCLPGTPSYCTRYCNDGICPAGLRCVAHANAFDGTHVNTCER